MREGKGKQYGYPAKDERDGGSRDSDTACGTFGAVGGGCVSAGACALMALRYFQRCRRRVCGRVRAVCDMARDRRLLTRGLYRPPRGRGV